MSETTTPRRTVSQRISKYLPKVGRARSWSISRPRALSKNSKAGAKPLKPIKGGKKKPKRVATPAVSEALKAAVKDGKFILWLGPQFTANFGSEIDTTTTLKAMMKFVKDAELNKKISIGLTHESGVKNAKDLLSEHFGETKFNTLFKACSVQKPALASSAFKLIKTLSPAFMIYEGIDRCLEEQFEHDNADLTSVTVAELTTLAALGNKAALEILLKEGEQYVLKPNGDVSKPDSLAFSQAEKYANYGLKTDKSALAEESIADDAKILIETLAGAAKQMPIVFIGCNFAAGPLMETVTGITKTNRDALKEGEVLPTHFALVPASAPALKKEEIGVEFTSVTPDDTFSQLGEYIAKLAQCREQSDDSLESRKMWLDNEHASTVALSEQEKKASTVAFWTRDVASAPVVMDAKYHEIMKENLRSKHKNETKTVHISEAIQNREKEFETTLIPPTVGEVEEPSRTLPVRVLVPKTFASQLADDGSISKTQKLVELLETGNTSLDIRVVEVEDAPEDFEIIFLKGKHDIADVSLAYKHSGLFFNVHWIEKNTDAAEVKAILFERMWTVAASKEESLKLLKDAIAAAIEASLAASSKVPGKTRSKLTRKAAKDKAAATAEMVEKDIPTEEPKKENKKLGFPARIAASMKLGKGKKAAAPTEAAAKPKEDAAKAKEDAPVKEADKKEPVDEKKAVEVSTAITAAEPEAKETSEAKPKDKKDVAKKVAAAKSKKEKPKDKVAKRKTEKGAKKPAAIAAKKEGAPKAEAKPAVEEAKKEAVAAVPSAKENKESVKEAPKKDVVAPKDAEKKEVVEPKAAGEPKVAATAAEPAADAAKESKAKEAEKVEAAEKPKEEAKPKAAAKKGGPNILQKAMTLVKPKKKPADKAAPVEEAAEPKKKSIEAKVEEAVPKSDS